MIFLSKIEATFTVPTRGCAIIPVISADFDLQIKAGDAVQLRGRSGSLNAQIRSVEWLTRRGDGSQVAFLLSPDVDCSQIGPDAEIWIESPQQTSAQP